MKNARQQKILELIEAYDIDTQETLIEKLLEEGIVATQTTISRDIRELKLIKGMSANGGYKYILPGAKKEMNIPVFNSVLTDSVLKIEAACNIVVIKTYPGMANAAAAAIDSIFRHEILGSIAGDDTIIAVLHTMDEANSTCKRILSFLNTEH